LNLCDEACVLDRSKDKINSVGEVTNKRYKLKRRKSNFEEAENVIGV